MLTNNIYLGKIAYFGDKKINSVYINISLKNENEKPTFTARATVYNKNKTYSIIAGQCLDELLPYLITNKLFLKVYRLWKLYHLNDMHAGTPRQEKAVKDFLKNNKFDYDQVCNYLQSINLLEDNGYKYGSAWLYEPIPKNDLNEIKELLKI